MAPLDLTSKFSIGINIDDSWRYAGVREPKSIIIPHLLSVSLPEGRLQDNMEEAELKLHGQKDPMNSASRASIALADSLYDMKADFVRCWFAWSFFEPTPVPTPDLPGLLDRGYQSYPMDSFVDSLTSKGVSIIPVLACGYQRMLPKGLSVDSDPDLFLKRAYTNARLIVRRYKDRVKHWQIENEPNWWEMHEVGGWRSGASWRSSAFRDDLLKVLNLAVHEEDSSATTIINLEGDRPISNISDFKQCDVIGLDFYPNYKASEPVSPAVIRQGKDYARMSGKPTFIAETGYPSGPSVLGYTSQRQAQYVESSVKEAFETDSVTGVGIWRYVDTAWRSFPDQENHFGLIDAKGQPKESWSALGRAIKELK